MPIAKGPKDYFQGGTWNIYCSVCGKKLKFDEAKRYWQGMWRCLQCWEPRQPQDFATAIKVKEMAIPYPQKESDQDVIAPAFPASGVAVANTFTFGINIWVFPQGANISNIKVNGVTVSQNNPIAVPAGQSIQFTYTKSLNADPPMWSWTS